VADVGWRRAGLAREEAQAARGGEGQRLHQRHQEELRQRQQRQDHAREHAAQRAHGRHAHALAAVG
jgi:hypothetical protein